MHLYVNITVVQNVPSDISAYNCTQAWLNHKLISMLISLDIAQYSPICNLLHKFYFIFFFTPWYPQTRGVS